MNRPIVKRLAPTPICRKLLICVSFSTFCFVVSLGFTTTSASIEEQISCNTGSKCSLCSDTIRNCFVANVIVAHTKQNVHLVVNNKTPPIFRWGFVCLFYFDSLCCGPRRICFFATTLHVCSSLQIILFVLCQTLDIFSGRFCSFEVNCFPLLV